MPFQSYTGVQENSENLQDVLSLRMKELLIRVGGRRFVDIIEDTYLLSIITMEKVAV